MLAILAAAAVAATPSEMSQPVRVVSADGAPVSVELVKPQGAVTAVAAEAAEKMPNLYEVPNHCRNLAYRVVDQQGRPIARRLADMPASGGLQLLVDRRIAGCRVVTVKYGVVAPDDPNPPSERYRVRPLPSPKR